MDSLKKIEKQEKKILKKQEKDRKRQIRRAKLNDNYTYRALLKALPWMNKFAAPILFVASMLIEILIEGLSRHSLYKSFTFVAENPIGFLYNAFIIFLPFIITFFFKRRIFSRTIIAVLWIVLGVINNVCLSKRVTPFNAQDIKVLGDAATLINNYMKPKEIIHIIIGIVLIVFLLTTLWKVAPKYQGKRHLIWTLIGTIFGIVSFFGFTKVAISSRAISNYFGNIAFAYEDYGLPYCFFSSVFNTGINKPNDYTQKAMETIEKESDIDKSKADTKKRPNILFVQLESFMDPAEISFLKTSEDPIPNFRKIKQNYSSGYFKVPSIGAGTSNTEFECLTGMSMRYFGPGEYPYKTILKEKTCESVASVLKKAGYNTHAIHNNSGNFYSRADVFNNMGFDTFTSKEEMNILSTTYNGWATDDILLEHIEDCLNSSDDPHYIYTITVQSHGKYPNEKILEKPEIAVACGEKENKHNAWEYYINEIHEVDNLIGRIVQMLESRDEDSILVMYGDHLPTMGLKTDEVRCRYLYNTEYVIWDNMGLEKKKENLSSYQITAEIMDRLGLHYGTFFNYHQNRRKTSDYQSDLELLQYDVLYGKQYIYDGAGDPNIKTHIKFGIYNPKVNSVDKISTGDYIITGQKFNQSSIVFVNGEKIDTNIWNDQRLIVSKDEVTIKDGDKIKVCQVGSKNRIFTSSNEFVFNENENIVK